MTTFRLFAVAVGASILMAGCSAESLSNLWGSESSSGDDAAVEEASGEELTPLEAAVETCSERYDRGITLGDDGSTLILHLEGEDSPGMDYAQLSCFLEKLDVPDRVISRMESTRALDGQVEDSWGQYAAFWTYHPDSGLNLTINQITE